MFIYGPRLSRGHTAVSSCAFQHFYRLSPPVIMSNRMWIWDFHPRGIYPNLLNPTCDFYHLFLCSQFLDCGSRPWTLSHFRVHHTHSPRMVNLTSQFIRTRLDAMLCAYECKHAHFIYSFFHGSCTVIFHRNMISCHAIIMLTHQFHMH